MPCSVEDLFSFLDQLEIEHRTTEHPPIFTAEQGRLWHHKIPGKPCKNLFLKDGQGGFWLVTLLSETQADLSGLAARLGCRRFSFAKPEALVEFLGITPGSATPFALINDKAERVKAVLDEDMMKCESISCHPLRNTASTTLRPDALLKFVKAVNHVPYIVACGRQQAVAHG